MLRKEWVSRRAGDTVKTQMFYARKGIITDEMAFVAHREDVAPTLVRDEVALGRLVIPANVAHLNLEPMGIGIALTCKVNANIGNSAVTSHIETELEKLTTCLKYGADTVMDLSTGGNIDGIRAAIVQASPVPIGTVPIYQVVQQVKSVTKMTADDILQMIEHQARQGVDYMTLHAGVLREFLPLVQHRITGIVSRGGSLMAQWMIEHGAENPLYTRWDDVLDICARYDVTISAGDGLRPGCLADASDAAQFAELKVLGELTRRAWEKDVQVMIEGPGHVPFDQIAMNVQKEMELCHEAPFYVLGPLVTDIAPGYDHITSAIGGAIAGWSGAAMLCYVTPKEHLGLPNRDDVKAGVIAYKIAAHAADMALGIPGTRDRDDELTKARAALNWEKHFELSFDPDTARAYHDEDLDVDTDFCAMCGHDWCSVRISKEIQEFMSGKAEGFERGKPVKSAALTPEQQEILAKRGVLSPDEIHKLATKTKKAMSAGARSASQGEPQDAPAKLSCHSDYVDPETAKKLQGGTLVQVDVRPALGIGKDEGRTV